MSDQAKRTPPRVTEPPAVDRPIGLRFNTAAGAELAFRKRRRRKKGIPAKA